MITCTTASSSAITMPIHTAALSLAMTRAGEFAAISPIPRSPCAARSICQRAMLPGICGESPFAIGLNESEIDPSLLLYFFKATYSCPAMGPNTPDERIVNMTGIISKEITIDQSRISPLKQLDANLPPELVICKQGLQLIIKTEDNSPACVKPETAMKLVERGWGHLLH